MRNHPLNLISVLRAERPVKEFRAELIKPMTADIINASVNEQPPTFPYHFHAALQSDGQIEDVLQCAPVIDDIKTLLQFLSDRQIQILDKSCALKIRGIQGINLLCTETAEQRFGIAALS